MFIERTISMAIAIKLVKVFDKDRSGTIDFIEYASMHQFITLMQKSFTQADRDRNGSLDAHEIHAALQSSGFTIGFVQHNYFSTRFHVVLVQLISHNFYKWVLILLY